MKAKLLLVSLAALIACLSASCSFNFELTSQRTALENQILGSYNELDNDVVMSSSVRSLDTSGNKKEVDMSKLQEAAVKARQDQDFNRDDIEEFKDSGAIGEANNGIVTVLPQNILKPGKISDSDLQFAKKLCEQENKDREIVWARIIQSNENLTPENITEVRQTFAKMQRDSAKKGQWVQQQDGRWIQKT